MPTCPHCGDDSYLIKGDIYQAHVNTCKYNVRKYVSYERQATLQHRIRNIGELEEVADKFMRTNSGFLTEQVTNARLPYYIAIDIFWNCMDILFGRCMTGAVEYIRTKLAIMCKYLVDSRGRN
mgnify:CR=1 FL=1